MALAAAVLASACGGGGGGDSYAPGTDLPASDATAVHFLTQATFGADDASIARLHRLGYSTWLREQMEMGASLHRPELEARAGAGENIQQIHRQEMWWRRAVVAPDQLRQRVAFALSQIFVISDRASALNTDSIGMAEYYDILVRNAFGNYRELIEQITLSPQMGKYLSMLRNRKPDLARNIKPDENYAREIMQLFSIGLVQLDQQGNVVRDGSNQPIPTYTQEEIVGLAHVFTGWTYAGSTSFFSATPNYRPMEPFEDYHDQQAKNVLGGVIFPAGRTAREELTDFLDRLAAHPNVAPFLAKQLIQRLVTSNPTPAYVGRIAAVWNDNGASVRGDLGAVVRAILLDAEAMTGQIAAPTTFGKLREPLLRLSALWRAFHARADDGLYDYTNPEINMAQAALRSETVFNFYRPDHQPQGELATASLVAPEFEILTHSTITTQTNQLYTSVNRHRSAAGTAPDQILIDLQREIAMAADPVALVDHLNVLLLAGTMSVEMHAILVAHLQAETDLKTRAEDAVHLVVTSPEFAIQK
ncbi:MAG: DUF1800 domain-containing protein [Planctomycetota bacterium]